MQFIIQDNFYKEPDLVRAFALSQDFKVTGNYPGFRTEPCKDVYFQGLRNKFEKIINKEITRWPTDQYNSSFQYTTSENKTWVHYDQTVWAAVVYLTPNPILDSGTALFRHKETGIFFNNENSKVDYNEVGSNPEDWEVIAETKNIYNRAVIYNGSYYHSSVVPGFGTNKHNGRLFQTFFFDT